MNNLELKIKEKEEQIKHVENEAIKIYNQYHFDWACGDQLDKRKDWYCLSSKGKELKKELNNLLDERAELGRNEEIKQEKTFVNGYGEATQREIMTDTYKRSLKRQEKSVLRNMGY